MGLPSLLRLTLPSLSLSLAHLLSLLSVPLLHTLLLRHLHFTYPATLALLHHSSILLSLLFWSLFGLFKPFPYSPYTLLPLALTSLPATLLPTLALARTSLALTHAAHLLSFPLVHLYRRSFTPTSLLSLLCASSGFALLALSEPTATSAPSIILALLAGLAPAFHHIPHIRLLSAIHGSELQLQLGVRAVLTFLLLPLTPLLDDYDPRSPASIFAYDWDEGVTILVLSTGLLAFLAFVAQRASATTLHPDAYVAVTHLVSLCVFAAHYVLFEHPFDPMQALAVALLMTGAMIVGDEEADMVRRREMARRRRQSRQSRHDEEAFEEHSDEGIVFDAWEERMQAPRIP